jgi:signal transduction histidine kinase
MSVTRASTAPPPPPRRAPALSRRAREARKFAAIGELAPGIAHEINTPTQYVGDNLRFVEQALGDVLDVVGALRGVADACRAAGLAAGEVDAADAAATRADLEFLGAELPAAIRQAIEGTERIAEIVRGVKAFSHSAGGATTASDLNQQLEAAITVSRNEWTYVADVVRDFDSALPLVRCRVGEINQVFLNIIVNAAQAIAAAQEGARLAGGEPRKGLIRISSRHDGGWVEVRITDNGSGIPEETRPRIFDPFFTTRAVGRGTGQGLAIAHGVIEKHGGRIDFETELGIGTTFVLRLPVAGPDTRQAPHTPAVAA